MATKNSTSGETHGKPPTQSKPTPDIRQPAVKLTIDLEDDAVLEAVARLLLDLSRKP